MQDSGEDENSGQLRRNVAQRPGERAQAAQNCECVIESRGAEEYPGKANKIESDDAAEHLGPDGRRGDGATALPREDNAQPETMERAPNEKVPRNAVPQAADHKCKKKGVAV